MASASVSDDVAGVFERLADDYDTVIPFFGRFGERLVDIVGVRAGYEVLEVAAGRGAATFPALARVGEGGRVVATDVAEALVRRLSADLGDHANATARVMECADLAWEMAELMAKFGGVSLLGSEAVVAARRFGATLCVSSADDGPGIRAAAKGTGVRYRAIRPTRR